MLLKPSLVLVSHICTKFPKWVGTETVIAADEVLDKTIIKTLSGKLALKESWFLKSENLALHDNVAELIFPILGLYLAVITDVPKNLWISNIFFHVLRNRCIPVTTLSGMGIW